VKKRQRIVARLEPSFRERVAVESVHSFIALIISRECVNLFLQRVIDDEQKSRRHLEEWETRTAVVFAARATENRDVCTLLSTRAVCTKPIAHPLINVKVAAKKAAGNTMLMESRGVFEKIYQREAMNRYTVAREHRDSLLERFASSVLTMMKRFANHSAMECRRTLPLVCLEIDTFAAPGLNGMGASHMCFLEEREDRGVVLQAQSAAMLAKMDGVHEMYGEHQYKAFLREHGRFFTRTKHFYEELTALLQRRLARVGSKCSELEKIEALARQALLHFEAYFWERVAYGNRFGSTKHASSPR
jgi:hypothetical protein